ncbi:hypothetical protein DVH24_009924 [Malus domestica]|uniref:Uncharacterized protein n=1 Tax=Malus domestica TaxID=3750 RepID=A0A498JNT8_MALDO|nr:hypothetical protein DVH24_009924 [Malus domestica]
MAYSALESTKGWEGEGSREEKGYYILNFCGRKQNEESCGDIIERLRSFANKSSAEAYGELICDIGGLVREKCCVEFKCWKMVSVDVKNFMVQQLSISLY